ncbi:hypothetical protein NIES4075_12040 [Tolypothrix sp. NIES-4075]|uniref:hypothetical protein n=1 Tax=Tolypothrix sp. NIES-4075 TaxID=2005459 RepID=UPI000B5CA279|nr:hypothetical protein [Tolypothrix sp. NIES-4075]GAX40241.1 hypothetical protein NIES4075_12040 [Tolypothrix sp. NIES-4075]
MAIDLDLLSTTNFRSTIQRYCNQLGWNIYDINERKAILRFNADSGNTQTLFIIKYQNTLEFSVPSALKFNSIDDVPGSLSSLLLSKNSKFKLGFWCLEEIENMQIFSIMHNAEISLINAEYFTKVVLRLVDECDTLEQTVAKALRRY